MDSLSRAVDDLLSSDEARAEAAASRLAAQGAAGLAVVRRLIESDDPETRWWATRAAAEFPTDQASDLLRRALDDPDLDVRRAATLGLRLRPAADAAPRLTELLADPDDLLRRLTSDALAAVGEPAVPILERVVRDPDATEAGYAARALAQMRTPRAIPALFAALEHESQLAQHWAERGLEDLGVGMVFVRPW